MSEKKDPPELPVYIDTTQVGTAEIPTPPTSIWVWVGVIAGVIALVVAVVAWLWRR